MLAKILAEKAVQVKVNTNREEPLLEKKAAMLKRTLQRAQNSKLDLYEEYRNGRMTRDKFIAAQEERQTAIDSMRDELAATEATITKLRVGKEKAAVLEADAKGIQLLNEYRPKELRKLIEKVRVYEARHFFGGMRDVPRRAALTVRTGRLSSRSLRRARWRWCRRQ